MPLSPPLTEEEKAFQPILATFLANADTQVLRNIVDKHSHETKKVAADLVVLREAFQTLEGRCHEDHRDIAELRGTVEKLQGANEELRASNGELRVVNEELRTSNEQLRDANAKLQSTPEKAMDKVNALENKVDGALERIIEKMEVSVGNTRTANRDLHDRLDQIQVNTRALDGLQKQMRQCDARTRDTESRQQNVEEVVEKLASMIDGPPSSQDLLPAAGSELYQDPRVHSSHDSRKRHYTYDRDDELADPQYGEGSKRRARDSYQDDTASRPTNPFKQPPRLARQDAIQTEHNTSQRPQTRAVPARAQTQPQASASNDTDELNPRWLAIKHHYVATKNRFAASKPKNQRNFIWRFIEGSGDDEFCTWFQEHLLEDLPSDKISRASKKSRRPGDRIVALGRTLTWEEVRQVIRDMPVPQFLE